MWEQLLQHPIVFLPMAILVIYIVGSIRVIPNTKVGVMEALLTLLLSEKIGAGLTESISPPRRAALRPRRCGSRSKTETGRSSGRR